MFAMDAFAADNVGRATITGCVVVFGFVITRGELNNVDARTICCGVFVLGLITVLMFDDMVFGLRVAPSTFIKPLGVDEFTKLTTIGLCFTPLFNVDILSCKRF